ncbi:MAG: transcriptional regulator, LuxR family [Gemmatimonadetes bacterium]|nr:transcriptional regulator, LuxR family [Gemmatimonadota bacterium]
MLDAGLQDRVHTLWDELAAFEASQGEEALLHLLRTVAGMVRAENAYWFGAVRLADADHDPLLGWRPGGIRYLAPLPDDTSFTRERLKSIERGAVDESTVAQARLAGTYRANRLCDLVPADWFESATYQGYLGRGVHDSLSVGAPVTPMVESYYGFLRMRADDPFTQADRDVALYAMRGLTWFHRQVLLSHGLLVARAPLTPLERRVLALLLTDQSEKGIATALEVSPSSLHTYVRDLARKFGVSGRKGLVGLWLGRQR